MPADYTEMVFYLVAAVYENEKETRVPPQGGQKEKTSRAQKHKEADLSRQTVISAAWPRHLAV